MSVRNPTCLRLQCLHRPCLHSMLNRPYPDSFGNRKGGPALELQRTRFGGGGGGGFPPPPPPTE
jgi:hypothetical protein